MGPRGFRPRGGGTLLADGKGNAVTRGGVKPELNSGITNVVDLVSAMTSQQVSRCSSPTANVIGMANAVAIRRGAQEALLSGVKIPQKVI